MQWLIDIITERIMSELSGVIVIWSGSLGTVPEGWLICDGTSGTPDLRDKFVVGQGPILPVGLIGGFFIHQHPFSDPTHSNTIVAGAAIAAGTDFSLTTSGGTVSGLTSQGSSIPPFYSMAFIMKS